MKAGFWNFKKLLIYLKDFWLKEKTYDKWEKFYDASFFFENLNIRTIVDEADDKDKEVDLLIDTRTAKTVLIIE